MDEERGPGDVLTRAVAEVVDTATGRAHRDDPAAPRTGGPAGNARLTAWVGLALLVLFLVEGVTLLSLQQMVSVHILVGALLVPVVLLKTATTGWRILRYYTGHPSYRRAGPPPLVLRVLGPLVVLTGLAVLGSGLALVPLGARTFDPLVTVAGMRVDALTVHQACFIAWFAVTTLHVLTRTVPALQLAADRRRPRSGHLAGAPARAALLVVTLLVGVVVGTGVLHLSGDWTGHGGLSRDRAGVGDDG